jgi:hypothetical protein
LDRRLQHIHNHEAERGVGLRRAGDPPALDRSLWTLVVRRSTSTDAPICAPQAAAERRYGRALCVRPERHLYG